MPTTTTTTPDARRITEQHPDYQRLHSYWQAELRASLRQLVADLRQAQQWSNAQPAATAFIRRQTVALQMAYQAAHHLGQRHYWQTVSHRAAPIPAPASHGPMQRTLTFYAPSVARMAKEALDAWRSYHAAHADRTPRIAAQRETTAIQLAGDANTDPMQQWLDGLSARVTLQADIVWPALADGYLDAGADDPANPYELLYWDLEPGAEHCTDCIDVSAASPYDPPWVDGGNQLTQSPGDGQTECGAACKCSFHYGGPGEPTGEMYQWADFFPVGMPQLASAPPSGVVVAPAPSDALTDGQQGALDRFRSAWDAWDAARGDLPSAPDMFGDDPSNDQYDLPLWDELTPDQQQALINMFGALVAWQSAQQTNNQNR